MKETLNQVESAMNSVIRIIFDLTVIGLMASAAVAAYIYFTNHHVIIF